MLITMNALPREVLFMFCAYLDFPDAAAVRLLNRDLSDIAAEFLVTRVRFHTSKKSLDRLKAISQHPKFSQSVKVLVYEAALLADAGCSHEYSRHFELDHHGLERPRQPPQGCSDRETRLYLRNKAKWDRNIYSKYEHYRKLYVSQQNILSTNYLEDTLSECILRFSRLESIDIDPIRKCSHMTSKRFIEEFGSDCASPLSCNFSRISEQLTYVLLPKNRILDSLRQLEVNALSPSFFKTDRASTLQQVFRHLVKIDISMKLGDGDIEPGEIAKHCFRRHLSNGVFRDALSSATNLEFVAIGVESPFPCFVDTSNLFASASWPRLRTLHLNTVSSTQEGLMAVLKRQPSLRSVSLALVNLTEGTWPDVLTQMRKELRLEHFQPIGYLEDSIELWPMDLLNVSSYVDDYEEVDLSTAISMYVTASTFMNNFYGLDDIDDEWDHPLLQGYDDFEDADFVRGMRMSDSDMSDTSDMSIDTMEDASMPDLEDSDDEDDDLFH